MITAVETGRFLRLLVPYVIPRTWELFSVIHRKMLIGLIAFFFILWFVVPLLFPFAARAVFLITLPARQLGVYVHEMGHGLFSVISGGRFHWFEMELMQGGVAITSGGSRLLILLGGLLGPTLFGVVLLQASTRAANTRWALISVAAFFALGVYFMAKPLFLDRARHAMLGDWSPSNLLMALLPAAAALFTIKMMSFSDRWQRFYLQALGVLMCFSGFSDTRYIFQYAQLPNGMYSDTRVAASLFWGAPESVPFWLFFFAATVISALNLGLMFWGGYRALRLPRDLP